MHVFSDLIFLICIKGTIKPTPQGFLDEDSQLDQFQFAESFFFSWKALFIYSYAYSKMRWSKEATGAYIVILIHPFFVKEGSPENYKYSSFLFLTKKNEILFKEKKRLDQFYLRVYSEG